MLFIGYHRCSTCKGIEALMQDKGLDYTFRDIKDDNPTPEELEAWHKTSGLPLKRFFNTSGMSYRERGLKDRLQDMSDDEKYQLLGSDGMLVKRPILITEEKVYVGADVKKYINSL
ncbi:arsenate reductase family protein [Peptoniphilus equinus]|uniref:Arsenate reductase family protein n=1 Tax=Peptoniphilus equinus TaxID=3016343 RepID=A0ABY7QWR8_9FIRM|nr:arsenate reductase family protein [Peptoniphilus equinus]WBW50353.1 arsenate reductase family protein [Peptoniphilus equinus]